MSYDYKTEKKSLFTDEGQKMFLRIRDWAHATLRTAGAFRMQEAMSGVTGDTWQMLACVDRLVELGEVKELAQPDCVGQHRVFVKGNCA